MVGYNHHGHVGLLYIKEHQIREMFLWHQYLGPENPRVGRRTKTARSRIISNIGTWGAHL